MQNELVMLSAEEDIGFAVQTSLSPVQQSEWD